MNQPTVHNPTNFEPSDYDVLDYLDNKRPVYYGQGSKAFEQEVQWWEKDMENTFGTEWRKKVHHCVHCGNGRVRWITAVKHVPTGDVVVFGSDCTQRLGFADKFAFKLAQLQAKAAAIKVRFSLWNKREKFLAANPEFAQAILNLEAPVHAKNSFARDVVSKLGQYGSLSEKQVNAVVASLKRDVEYASQKATGVEEVKGDAPSGRVAVKGVVLSTKVQEGFYGAQLKMLLKLENNSKVWVTVPSKAYVEKGQTLTVTATWTPSQDDKSFAYGSRPVVHSEAASL